MKQLVVFTAISILCIHVCAQSKGNDTIMDRIEQLPTVVVEGHKTNKTQQMQLSQSMTNVNKEYIDSHLSGSLMQSLDAIPGIQTMSIGSGESKPVIRGLGFNRMIVTENGIKHEGQQWGEDHGLEINQMDIDRVEVIKGPAALLYGSDAIGGVINTFSNTVPTKRFEGTAEIVGQSNNASLGATLRLGGIDKKGWYYKICLSGTDYADYRVPIDSIQYYSYYIKLYKHRLRNTAGKEMDASAMIGYTGDHLSTNLRISDTYMKSGFFANAHGLEVRLSDIDYDTSERDIDLPYHNVNHFMATSQTIWHVNRWHVNADVAFQHNVREERSEPVSHGYMPMPDGTMERRFVKNTYTANLGAKRTFGEQHNITFGANTEYQYNKRGGWGFIIPDFKNLAIGIHVADRYYVTNDLILSAGVRYDWTRTHIYGYSDWYVTPTEQGGNEYKVRSFDRLYNFNSVTWSIGVNYASNYWMLKSNIGKGFRTPIPKELGTDGVNYNIFRFEKGNPELNPESSYQLDASVNYDNQRISFGVDPYVNYFSNYIYLNPTSKYCEGLQEYNYQQCRVVRWGFEVNVGYQWLPWLESKIEGEYLYARQLSGEKKGYTLPFSVPWNVSCTIMAKTPNDNKGYVALSYRLVGDQNEIVPPEISTPGYYVIDASAGKCFHLGGVALTARVQARNLLNRRYYDHTSYYRLIGVPNAGRNFILVLAAHF